MNLTLFLILAAASARITRFLWADTFIEGLRDRFLSRLMMPPLDFDFADEWKVPLWRRKLHDLATCPVCLSVWVSAFIVVAYGLLAADWGHWVHYPLYAVAVSAGAVTFLEVWDGARKIVVEQEDPYVRHRHPSER